MAPAGSFMLHLLNVNKVLSVKRENNSTGSLKHQRLRVLYLDVVSIYLVSIAGQKIIESVNGPLMDYECFTYGVIR